MGVDDAGTDGGDADVVLANLLPKCFAEGDEGGLGGTVGGGAGRGAKAHEAGGADDVTTFSLDHGRQELLDADQRPPEVDSHNPSEIFERRVDDFARHRDAGVVEENGRSTRLAFDEVGEILDIDLDGDIDHSRPTWPAERADLRGDLIKSVLLNIR